MKRLQQPQNHNADPNSTVSAPANPKRTRGTENKNSVSDSDVHCVQKPVSTSKPKVFQVHGGNVVAESNSNVNTSENSFTSYNLRSKNPKSVRDAAASTNNNNSPKRIQQPDVFVNTHLLKIKMEVDYVPIKKELDQETGDENNSNGSSRVNSTSFSVESRDNNTNSSQNVDEDNHEFRVLDYKREQQQQQQETVATLQDRINSLSREKVEMQRTLQNEIDQLKIANAQHQTNIHALNSLATLQRDENAQLKSQVAAQQNQIEELNQKSKSRDENQTPQISNWPTTVLSLIFDHLDLKSVKASRLVCRRWRNEAGKILLSNFYLVCDDKKRCENALINWLRNSYSNSKAEDGKLLSKDKNGRGTLQLLRKFKMLRNSITEFVFSPAQTLMENLYEILNQLPNLQVLEIKALDLSPQQKWLINDKILYNGNPIKLELLIQKLATAKKLKLDFFMTKAMSSHFLHHRQQLASIKSLEIRLIGMNFMRSFMQHSFFCNWTITRLTFAIQENYDVQLIRRFLLTISPSLQHLKLMLQTPHDNLSLPLSVSSFKPWTDDWIIPLGLIRVETLEIEKAYYKEELVLKCVVSALQLPRLKKLTLVDILFGLQLEHIIHKWNSHESAKGRKLWSESLEELEISSWFASTLNSKKIPRNPWPRLKSLKCAGKFSVSFDTSFLSELRNLEQLELRVSWDWTIDQNIRMKNEADDKRSSSQFQLRDLKNLKSFCLKFWGNEQRYQDFTNTLVAKDLKFMKNLQYVQFNGVVINPEPLRSALGPNVPIIFIN